MQDGSGHGWKDSTSSDIEFIKLFNRFASDRRFSGTYKPVFLKSLLDLGKYKEDESNGGLVGSEWVHMQDDKVIVDLNFVATRFLKYYWDMEYSFKFRQSSNRNDANIRKIIRRITVNEDKKPPTREQIANSDNDELRKEVIMESMKREVMKHILTPMPNLFEKVKGRPMSIKFDRNIIGFFDRHRDTVLSIINHKLVVELEKYNSMTPRIATKVSYEHAVRPPIPKIDKHLVLWSQGDERCFYCNEPRNKTHFDHVIPYNHVGSHDVYNIVASCQECNCSKHDKLPTSDLFDKVVGRNNSLKSMIDPDKSPDSAAAPDPRLLGALGKMVEYAEETYREEYRRCEMVYCAATYGNQEKFRPDPPWADRRVPLRSQA